jgi:hypothetical protein
VAELPDLTKYSNQELGDLIRDLRLRSVAYQAQLATLPSSRERTIKLVRGTVLVAGGLHSITFGVLAAILLILGAWDWVETVRSDVETMNRQIEFRRALFELTRTIEAAEAELDRRSNEATKP